MTILKFLCKDWFYRTIDFIWYNDFICISPQRLVLQNRWFHLIQWFHLIIMCNDVSFPYLSFYWSEVMFSSCTFGHLRTALVFVYVLTHFTWRHHQNNLGCAILVVNVNVCYSVKCAFLGDAHLHVNLLTANMVSRVASVAACDARARGQYIHVCMYDLTANFHVKLMRGWRWLWKSTDVRSRQIPGVHHEPRSVTSDFQASGLSCFFNILQHFLCSTQNYNKFTQSVSLVVYYLIQTELNLTAVAIIFYCHLTLLSMPVFPYPYIVSIAMEIIRTDLVVHFISILRCSIPLHYFLNKTQTFPEQQESQGITLCFPLELEELVRRVGLVNFQEEIWSQDVLLGMFNSVFSEEILFFQCFEICIKILFCNWTFFDFYVAVESLVVNQAWYSSYFKGSGHYW